MSEFLGFNMARVARVASRGLLYSSLAVGTVGCVEGAPNGVSPAQPFKNSGEVYTPPEPTPNQVFYEETWTAKYINSATGQIAVIPYANTIESPPDINTCPETFPVVAGQTWTLVECMDYSLVELP